MNPLSSISSNSAKKILGTGAGVFKKIPWVLANHAFLAIMICVALELLLGGWLFYRYAASVTVQDPLAIENPVVFKEAVYQSVLKEWRAREAKKNSVSGLPAQAGNSPNPFY